MATAPSHSYICWVFVASFYLLHSARMMMFRSLIIHFSFRDGHSGHAEQLIFSSPCYNLHIMFST